MMNRMFVMVLVTLMLFMLAAASFRSSARTSELSKLYLFKKTPTPTVTPTPLPSPSPSTTPTPVPEPEPASPTPTPFKNLTTNNR